MKGSVPSGRRASLLRSIVGGLLLVGVACTSATTPVTTRSTSAPSQPDAEPGTPTAFGGTPSTSPSVRTPRSLTLEAPPGGSFLVRGTYPRVRSACVRPERPRLHARYPGTLRIERSDDGLLALTLTIPFRAYLEGIAEVPPSWPMAALQAQAIAARSYALATTGWDGEEGATLDTPICGTTACQVYRGIPLTPSSDTRRWFRAVRSTDGEVLLYQGRPADTVYFSTSDGRTYGNEDVFGSAPLPYLRPVIERNDGASPVSRWSVRLRFEDLARFLAAAAEWPADVAISDVRLEDGTVTVSGGGESRSMTLTDFRDAVNTWAPCLAPRRYPPGGLPTTIPSRWVSLSSGIAAVTATGRGWGHGVGMVQWGAYGKARRGLSADEILAFYYGGLRPEPFPEPGLIHVEVATGLTSLSLAPSGAGARLNGEPLEPGHVVVTGREELTVRTS